MIVRKANISEIPAVVSVFVASVEGLTEVLSVQHAAAWISGVLRQSYWQELLRSHYVAVCYDGDAIVGFVAFSGMGELSMLYVTPSHQRQGIGSRLINHVRHHAIEEGYAHLKIYANNYIHALLTKHGFEKMDDFTRTIKGVEFQLNLYMADLI
ncbi:MAG: GNAT family N-acetyltransferase [Bacteroidia bacterium]|jgi:putative acetyltransferase